MNVSAEEIDLSGHGNALQQVSALPSNSSSQHAVIGGPSSTNKISSEVDNEKLKWMPKSLDIQQGKAPSSPATSPLSVLDIYVDPKRKSSVVTPPPKLLNKRRGLDSPVKAVDNQNVFSSSVATLTRRRSFDKSIQDLLESLPLEGPVISPSSAKQQDDVGTPSTTVNNVKGHEREAPPRCHRRQDTSESANSAVAAVARGAFMAEAEANQSEIVLDKPVLCPQRQKTEGLADDVIKTSSPTGTIPTSNRTSKTTNKKSSTRQMVRPRRRRPPPRHDSRRASRASMMRMKKVVMEKKEAEAEASNGDDRVDNEQPRCPKHQENEVGRPGEQQTDGSLSIQDIVVPPESLERNTSDAQDTRDDDSLILDKEDNFFRKMNDPIPASAVGTTDDPVIQAWLNMSSSSANNNKNKAKKSFYDSEPILSGSRWDYAFGPAKDRSEPSLRVPRDLLVPTKSNRNLASLLQMEGEAEEEEGEGYQTIPQDFRKTIPNPQEYPPLEAKTTNDDDSSSASLNDHDGDDRMFEAWMKMRTRTLYSSPTATEHADQNNDDDNKSLVLPVSLKDTKAETIQLCETMESSLPSFHPDFQGSVEDGEKGDQVYVTPLHDRHNTMDNTFSHALRQHSCMSPTPHWLDGDTPTTEEGNSRDDIKRRSSLPPVRPTRNKPSLHLREEDKKNTAIDELWSSMPAISCSIGAKHGKGPSWPTIRSRLDSEDTTLSRTSLPPSLPKRHRRQDSLLSEEANCETMQPPKLATTENFEASSVTKSTISRRSTMPPHQPHRRTPSLHLDGSFHSIDEDQVKQNQPFQEEDQSNKRMIDAMWSSMPISSEENWASSRSSLLAPPSMPHRRKPSLNILEDGDEGMIEIWLSHCQAASDFSSNTAGSSNAVSRRQVRHVRKNSSASSVACDSIILLEDEMEI